MMILQHSFNDNNNISLDKFVPNIKFGLALVDDVSIFDQRYFYEMSYFLYNVIKVKMLKRYSSKIKKIYIIEICFFIINSKITNSFSIVKKCYVKYNFVMYKKRLFYTLDKIKIYIK